MCVCAVLFHLRGKAAGTAQPFRVKLVRCSTPELVCRYIFDDAALLKYHHTIRKAPQPPEPRITGFSCSGHSGYAEEGSDIVCAAVTTAVRFAECTINDVLGERAKTRVKEDEARISLTLPATCENEEAVQAVLTGMMLTLCSLRDEYPDYIEVLEVSKDA